MTWYQRENLFQMVVYKENNDTTIGNRKYEMVNWQSN